MWSSSFHSLVAAALVAGCTSDPQVVIDVKNTSGGGLQVYSCKAGGHVIDGETVCRQFTVESNQHSIGIYTGAPAVRVIFQFTGNALYCQQLDLDLSATPIAIAYAPGPTAAPTAITSCEPATACAQLASCQ